MYRSDRLSRARHLLAFGLAFSAAALAVAPVAGAASHPARHLSLKNITIDGSATENYLVYWVAQEKGYFKQQGLNVNLLNESSTAAAHVAGLVANAYQFAITGPAAVGIAIQQSAPLRSIFVQDEGCTDEMAISSSVAAAHNIPTTGDPVKQIQALKGSHLTIGYGNAASTSYLDTVYLFQKYGITYGPSASFDVNLQPLGAAATLIAALNTGKISGFVSNPPNSVQPNTITIPYASINPLNHLYTFILSTNISTIQQHADTVQALVNALTEAWAFSKSNPKAATAIGVRQYEASGATSSPEVAQYLTAIDQSGRFGAGSTPAPTRIGYAAERSTIDAGNSVPLTVPYASWISNKFVDKAIATYGLRVPTS